MDAVQPQDGLPVLAFGPFRLQRCPHLLYLGEAPVRLGGRAIVLLAVLVERAGEVLSRAELERRVWPNTMVEDSSLRVHIAALRRALGDGIAGARYIANVPGRGYCFVAPVAAVAGAASKVPLSAPARQLPVRLNNIIGRDEAVRVLGATLPARRLVTIVGHGGMGKTALALALASGIQPGYPDGVCFIDLAPLTDPALVPEALAGALGIPVIGESVLHALDCWLRPRRMLLVVDNCEHVLDAATALIARVLLAAPDVDVLATSREPLDADGEWVYRLQPLASPPDGVQIGCAEALAFPALRLLVERASASGDTFALSDASLAAAAALCRRVDGVPLAIEFVAARVGMLGVEGVTNQLDDRLSLLGSGHRTVLPRHRTLRALLDWSHELLTHAERRVLRCCGIFNGPFTLESAIAVVARGDDAAEVRDCLLSLVAKSLIVFDPHAGRVCFAMLEITRAYAADRLADDPDCGLIAARHACHMIEVMRECEADWGKMRHAVWHGSR